MVRPERKDDQMNTNSAAPQRLYLMQVATIPQMNLPFVCYLVQTGDCTNILIDSGLAEALQPPTGSSMPTMRPELLEALSQLDRHYARTVQLLCSLFYS